MKVKHDIYKESKVINHKDFMAKIKANRIWEKKHPGLTKFKVIIWWLRYGIINKIQEIPLNIKTFIQRGVRGWADSDTWDFSYYLGKVISGGVKCLKDNTHGLPAWTADKTEQQAIKEWDEILDTIIKTFQTTEKIANDELFYIPSKKFTEKECKYRKKLAKKINNNKDNDLYGGGIYGKVMNKKEVLEFEKGFLLFGENFFSLWD